MNIRRKFLMFSITALLLSGLSLGQNTPSADKLINGKKFIPYKIKAKDTWTNVALRNESTLKELQEANTGISDLKIGQIIYIPSKSAKTVASESIQEIKKQQDSGNEQFVHHTVQQGQTLYRISKLYNQTIPDIMKWNNLTNNNIALGSKLIVGKGQIATIKNKQPIQPTEPNELKEQTIRSKEEKNIDALNSVTTDPIQSKEPTEKNKSASEVVEKNEIKSTESQSNATNKDFPPGSVEKITETGIATWLNDQELNQNKFYALHRTAAIGTIIKVTNRMNNNSVFVKVVGVLPDTGDNEKIIIKITSAAAQRIGAIDLKFTAELSYGVSH